MTYIPHTDLDIEEMLRRIGKEKVADLFDCVPEPSRLQRPLDLPGPLDEEALRREMASLSRGNHGPETPVHFLGAGAYDHVVPAPVWHLLSRSELYSAYTPYQPEISQGTLQALFEFQTLVCQLTGLEVANASMYDGASAAAEAVLMALRITRRKRVLVSEALHPEYRQVIATYARYGGIRVDAIPVGPQGVTEAAAEATATGADPACVVLQSPNFLGCVEDVRGWADWTRRKGGMLIQVVTEPLSLGLLVPPGAAGADIAVGELQSFGIPLAYGGPYAGFFAARQKHVRSMPGRIVGETLDHEGRRGFVLTLSTREQHIRRARATSNICTNHNLCALASTIYLSQMGRKGLREMAWLNLSKAAYARGRLAAVEGIEIPFSGPSFNEFVVRLPVAAEKVLASVREKDGILGGLPLGPHFPALDDHILVCVTEKRTREEIDRFCDALEARCREI